MFHCWQKMGLFVSMKQNQKENIVDKKINFPFSQT